MKKIFFWIGILLFLAACSSQKGIVQVADVSGEEMAEDSIEYGLETFDSKFETWYKLHDNPVNYRSTDYYKNWNDKYVTAWNQNALDPAKSSFFQPIVGYDRSVDYGFELNHELFYYFQYVENVLHIPIMAGSPQSLVF